jgi:hypothetical protein
VILLLKILHSTIIITIEREIHLFKDKGCKFFSHSRLLILDLVWSHLWLSTVISRWAPFIISLCIFVQFSSHVRVNPRSVGDVGDWGRYDVSLIHLWNLLLLLLMRLTIYAFLNACCLTKGIDNMI